MAQYRKKPVVIEAFRLGHDPIPDWFMDGVSNDKCIIKTNREEFIPFEFDNTVFAEIQTLEGTMKANNGDFIIKGIKGELYPCKPDVFEMTYEKVD